VAVTRHGLQLKCARREHDFEGSGRPAHRDLPHRRGESMAPHRERVAAGCEHEPEAAIRGRCDALGELCDFDDRLRDGLADVVDHAAGHRVGGRDQRC
jgi:hypothetical protein